MKVLVLNAGSSSQKSCLYELPEDVLPDQPPQPVWEAQIDRSDDPGAAALAVKSAQGQRSEDLKIKDRTSVIDQMLKTLWSGPTQVIQNPAEIDLVGHRVVHGGQEYQESVLITPAVKAAIARLAEFAPLHNPVNLEGIEAVEQCLQDVPQVAVFDTAFHSQLPPAAAVYPGPYEWLEQGIRRYGFHGISHQYCAQRSAMILQRNLENLRLIICHLGSGCSLAAIQKGHSIDTTMGFTPLEGLMMGTRSGSVDPGILIYLLRQGYSADTLEKLLNQDSGLQGVSGLSSDMRQIQAAIAQGDSRAKLAFDIYGHRLRAAIGAMLASLGGLDALVFTAGVGENSPAVRGAACEGFGFLGLKLDLAKNNQSPVDADIATADSTVRVVVVNTQEDWAIAQEAWQLVKT